MSSNAGWPGNHGPGQAPRPGPYGPGPWGYVPAPPKPGVIPLHPLTLSDIITGVFNTLKRYLLPIYAPLMLVALVGLIPVGISATVTYGTIDDMITASEGYSDYTPSHGQVVDLFVYGGITLLLTMLTSFALYVVGSTVSTTVLRYAVVGRKLTARQTWQLSRPALGRVIGETLLLALAPLAGLLVVGLIAAGIGFATDNAAAVVLISLPLMFAFFIALLYVQVRLVLVVPVMVLEQQGPVNALRRAWKLNQGAWWRSLGIPYLINLVGSFAGQIVALPFIAIGMVPLFSWMAEHPGATDQRGSEFVGRLALFYIWSIFGALVSSVLTLPLTPLTNGLLYLDRRIRFEGLDLALAAEAGIELHPAPVPYGPPAPRTSPTDTPAPTAVQPEAPTADDRPDAPGESNDGPDLQK